MNSRLFKKEIQRRANVKALIWKVRKIVGMFVEEIMGGGLDKCDGLLSKWFINSSLKLSSIF